MRKAACAVFVLCLQEMGGFLRSEKEGPASSGHWKWQVGCGTSDRIVNVRGNQNSILLFPETGLYIGDGCIFVVIAISGSDYNLNGGIDVSALICSFPSFGSVSSDSVPPSS